MRFPFPPAPDFNLSKLLEEKLEEKKIYTSSHSHIPIPMFQSQTSTCPS